MSIRIPHPRLFIHPRIQHLLVVIFVLSFPADVCVVFWSFLYRCVHTCKGRDMSTERQE